MTIDEKATALIRKAHEVGKKQNTAIIRSYSSLGKVIKTKAQADAFMRQLKSL